MKVVFLNPVGVIGGAERVLLVAIQCLLARPSEFQPQVVLLAEGPLQTTLQGLGVPVTVVPLPAALAGLGDTQFRGRGRWSALGLLGSRTLTSLPAGIDFLRRLRSVLRTQRPDLIHSNGQKTHALAALARPAGVPVVWHLHDFPSERPVMARALNQLRHGVRAGLAISAAVGRDASQTFPGLRIEVVRNAVDTVHFTPDGPGADLDILANQSAGPEPLVRVGLVATYANWKGHGVFLEALARLRSPQVRGYIIGGPIYTTAGSQVTREELTDRVRVLGLEGHVGFVPFQQDPASVYRALDVVVHASTRPEPFGLTIAEAMSCGKAVVVAAAGGAGELFTPGVSGLGHTIGDAQELADALDRLCSDAGLRTRLGTRARIEAIERFGLTRYGAELATVYRSVLS